MYRFALISLYSLIFVFVPYVGHTQFSFPSALYFETVPTFPEQGESFTVTLPLHSSEFAQAEVKWFINNKENTEYRNEHTIALETLISDTIITARVTLPQGEVTEVRKVIPALRTDIVIQADTLTPAFYSGNTLPSSGSTFTATALVFKDDVRLLNGLSYIWRVDGKLQNNSTNKNSIVIVPSFEKEVHISAEIQNSSNQTIAKESVSVPVLKPELYFYEKNLLRGLTFTALNNPYTFIGDEMTIRAEGYFMSKELRGENVLYEWEIGGRKVDITSENPQEITLRREGNNSTVISFHVRNLLQLLQGVKGDLAVKF